MFAMVTAVQQESKGLSVLLKCMKEKDHLLRMGMKIQYLTLG